MFFKLTLKVWFLIYLCHKELYGARILAVFPTPSISHQVVFRPLTQELAKRGHEVTVITPDPAYPLGGSPSNLYEIDLHDISYELKKIIVTQNERLDVSMISRLDFATQINEKIFEAQLNTIEFQNILKKGRNFYDLLILEAWVDSALIMSHIFEAPVIQISSLGPILTNREALGIPTHPLVYVNYIRHKFHNLSLLDKVKEYILYAIAYYLTERTVKNEQKMLKKYFGDDIPSLSELKNNIDLLFLSNHPIWAGNIPVPANVIFLGGLHKTKIKDLPQDLKSQLDQSRNGVIYISFGSNIRTHTVTNRTKQIFFKVLSDLPYDVLWKWDGEELSGRPKNVKTSKWFPQADLLYHPNVKLFITQGGMQSTEEALAAGVPLIGLPHFGDQLQNVEQIVALGVGLSLDMNTFTELNLKEAINSVMHDKSFRQNIESLRSKMMDQPETPLERAVWWTEYVLRHGGARHLRSPGANISWWQYYEVELILYIIFASFMLLVVTVLTIKTLFKIVRRQPEKVKAN